MTNLPAVKAPSSLVNRFKNRKVSAAPKSGVDYLTFSGKRGGFLLGRDKDEVEGERMLINSNMFSHGWAIWVDKVCTKTLVPIDQDLPPEPDPQEDRRGKRQYPSEARGFQASMMEDGGNTVQFETNSMGGVKGVSSVIDAVYERIGSGEESYLYPCVELKTDSYFNETANDTIYNPVFEIVSWHDVEGNIETSGAAVLEDNSDEGADEAPAKRQRRKRA